MSIPQEVSSESAPRLLAVIDRIALKQDGIPHLGDQATIYPYQKNGRQEDMIVDTGLVRRIGNRANQVNFGKQPNGILFPLKMSPTNQALERFRDSTITGGNQVSSFET